MNRLSLDGVRRASKERENRIKRGIEVKRRGGKPVERGLSRNHPSFYPIVDVIAHSCNKVAIK